MVVNVTPKWLLLTGVIVTALSIGIAYVIENWPL